MQRRVQRLLDLHRARTGRSACHRVQLTSDGHKVYLNAVIGAFADEVDYTDGEVLRQRTGRPEALHPCGVYWRGENYRHCLHGGDCTCDEFIETIGIHDRFHLLTRFGMSNLPSGGKQRLFLCAL